MGSEQHAATRGIMQSIGGQWGTLFERRVALLHCTCNRVAPGFKDRGERGGGVHLHCGRYLLITSRLASLSSGTCSPSFSVHVKHEGVGNGAKGDRWDGTAGRGVFVVSGTRAFC